MTIPANQEAYLSVYNWIASSETSFHFEASLILIDLFARKFPEMKGMKIALVDLYNDLYLEKNQNYGNRKSA